MAKDDDREFIAAYYGIDVRSNEVERVSECRNRDLVQTGKDGKTIRHTPFRGNRAEMELPAVFHLIDAFEVSIDAIDLESTKLRIKELEAKAAKRKTTAQS